MKKLKAQIRLVGWNVEALTTIQFAALKILVESNGFIPTPKEYAAAYENLKK